jgi:hypothetical protein
MMAAPVQSDTARYGVQLSSAIGGNAEVRQVAGMVLSVGAMMRFAVRVEMLTGTDEFGRIAHGFLMDMDAMGSRRKTVDDDIHPHLLACRFKLRRPDESAVRISNHCAGAGYLASKATCHHRGSQALHANPRGVTNFHRVRDALALGSFRCSAFNLCRSKGEKRHGYP